MKKLFILLLFTGCLSIKSVAQYPSDFMLGFKVGAVYSGINNIGNMIYPEDFFDPGSYHLKTQNVFGAVAGIFLHVNVPDTWLSLQPEVLFSMQGTRFLYDDIGGLNYRLNFNYNYLSAGLLLKAHLEGLTTWEGFSLRAGPRIGFVLNPSALNYTSNGSELGYGPDITEQQNLRSVLKGRMDVSIGVGLAYEFSISKIGLYGMSIEAMYYFGVSDVIETQVNSYNFVEKSNFSNSIQLTIGYTLDMTMPRSYYKNKRQEKVEQVF